jgi:hypothetical protein
MNENNRQKSGWQRKRAPAGGRGSSSAGRHQGQDRRQNGSGNAKGNYERYMALAREAALSGDTVEMENCYQHAEHYFRVMRERTS